MAGGKESPRQKMIGMMYLVLTALLALNVSKDILDAFTLVDNGLRQTNEILVGKSEAAIAALAGNTNKEKTAPFLAEAQKVDKIADDMNAYIEELKARVYSVSHTGNPEAPDYKDYMADGKAYALDAKDPESGKKYITKPDENQNNTNLLIGPSPEAPKDGPWTATELRTKLEGYGKQLASTSLTDALGQSFKLSDGMKDQLTKIFTFPDTEKDAKNDIKAETWQTRNFYHVPLASIIPTLTKLQVDVENARADVINELGAGVEGKSYKFTNLVPLVVPESNYILRGDSFRAKVLLAAYDATNLPQIYVDNSLWDGKDSSAFEPGSDMETLPGGSDGLGSLRIPTNGLGLGDKQFKGVINYKGPEGNIEAYPFIVPPFTVAEPALVVSPTKMNVFYRGVPNPVEISVPGAKSISASCPGHTMTQGSNGEYIVKPGSGRTANISVTATMPDGSTKSMPPKEFRVKSIPDPVPVFGGKGPKDSSIPKTGLANQAGLVAKMDNFDFEVNVSVVSFKMVFIKNGQPVTKPANSNRLTGDMKAALQGIRRGEIIYFEDIMVTMPGGERRKVNNLAFKVV